jgi:hypothetical protein
MRGKNLTYIALAIIVSLTLTTILGTRPASALEPTVFIVGPDNADGTTPTAVFPRVATGAYFYAYVKIKDVPHLTGEDGTGPGGTNPTDVIWAYQVSLRWNSLVLELTSTYVYEPGAWTPGTTGTTMRSVLKYGYWEYQDPDWVLTMSYATSWGKSVDTAGGVAIVGMTLQAEDAGTPWNFIALPPEMNPADPAYVPGCPDEGYHQGTYYDLPYGVTDKYDMLVRLRFKNLDPGGVAGTMWSPIEIVPGTVDTKLKTIGQTDVIPTCLSSFYGGAPVPEFPFGLGVVMMIAPAVALMYLWRTRKKMTHK